VAKGDKLGGNVKEASAAGGAFGAMLTEFGDELLGMLMSFGPCCQIREMFESSSWKLMFFWRATESDSSARCLILKRWEPNRVHRTIRAKQVTTPGRSSDPSR
jgi:hypothetical protein